MLVPFLSCKGPERQSPVDNRQNVDWQQVDTFLSCESNPQSMFTSVQRIAAEEEILVVPQSVQRSTWTSVPDHITNSVASCLSKMWVRTYTLLEHERGCHSKLIGLAKESLHFRSMKLTNPGPSPELPPAKALHISEGVELPGPTFEPEAGQNLQKREVLASIQALADATFPVSTEELTPRPTTRVHPHYLNSLRRRVVGRKAYLPLHPFPRDPAI